VASGICFRLVGIGTPVIPMNPLHAEHHSHRSFVYSFSQIQSSIATSALQCWQVIWVRVRPSGRTFFRNGNPGISFTAA